MEGCIYILCTCVALVCAVSLLRGYARSHTRLLMWCGLFFLALATENLVLFVDLELVPNVDLSLIRSLIPLAGVAILLYGLVWDTK